MTTVTPVSVTPASMAAATVSALWRGSVAALAGIVLVAGLALMWWAISPAAGLTPAESVRAGMVAVAAAHFLPVTIAGAELTLRPLLLTAVVLGIIITSVGRGRVPRGPAVELVHAAVFAIIYAIVIDIVVTVAAPDESVRPGLAAPLALAVVGVMVSLCGSQSDLRRWWQSRAPAVVRVGLRAGAVGVGALATAGALLLAAAMVASFPDTMAIAELTVDSVGSGIGLAAVGLAFVPNAVIAAIGYLAGAGFSIGQASFSPLVWQPAELPAIPLLAAAPQGTGPAGYLTLALPVAVALLVAAVVVREIRARGQRLAACAIAAAVLGIAVAGLAAIASGGVSGGPWARTGVPALLAGGLIAGVTALVAGSAAATAGGRRVPWSLAPLVDVGAASAGVAAGSAGDRAAGSVGEADADGAGEADADGAAAATGDQPAGADADAAGHVINYGDADAAGRVIDDDDATKGDMVAGEADVTGDAGAAAAGASDDGSAEPGGTARQPG